MTELISQTEAAAETADHAARAARAAAVDIATPDPSAARQNVIVSELIRDRHKAALTTLRDKLAEVKSVEYAAKWNVAYQRTQAKRDEAAAEFAAFYPEMVAKLAALFQKMAAVDAECDAINSAAPGGDGRRLKCCEVKARGLEDFSSYSPPIMRELRLPEWERSRAWWPPQRQIDSAMFVPVVTDTRRNAGQWWKIQKEENEKLRQETERRIEEQQERDRKAKLAFEDHVRRHA